MRCGSTPDAAGAREHLRKALSERNNYIVSRPAALAADSVLRSSLPASSSRSNVCSLIP
jgi:hypothetical protein